MCTLEIGPSLYILYQELATHTTNLSPPPPMYMYMYVGAEWLVQFLIHVKAHLLSCKNA